MDFDATAAELLRQMQELTRTAVLWMVVSVLLALFLLIIILLLLRMRKRARLVENWLVQEMRVLQEGQTMLQQRILTLSRPKAPPPPAPAPQRPAGPPQQTAPPRGREPQRTAASQPAQPLDLTAALNEMLAGNQPYNFIETIRALDPRLNLQRLTPRMNAGLFTKDTMLDLGGDGLFASIDGDSARLYPNYSRFSATLDPKPLFDGARHGARIHSIAAPAQLARQTDGTWKLMQKGRVQMRQGN